MFNQKALSNINASSSTTALHTSQLPDLMELSACFWFYGRIGDDAWQGGIILNFYSAGKKHFKLKCYVARKQHWESITVNSFRKLFLLVGLLYCLQTALFSSNCNKYILYLSRQH